MNLLAYTWRTAPNSFIAPAILVAGIVAAIAQDELPSALVAFAFLVAVLTITIVGTMQDYQRDVLTRVERLVAWSFGNNQRHGHRTPTMQEGLAYIEAAKADPFAPFEFAHVEPQRVLAWWYAELTGLDRAAAERKLASMPMDAYNNAKAKHRQHMAETTVGPKPDAPRRDWTFARERRVIRQAFHALTA